jgi:glucan phosphoethanolaminetransferase (alkaline phosphatase superfamily)
MEMLRRDARLCLSVQNVDASVERTESARVGRVPPVEIGRPEPPWRARRRTVRRLRKTAGLALLSLPVFACVAIDASRRGQRILDFHGYYLDTYLGAIAESMVLWGTLLYAASRRSGFGRWIAAVLFVIGITCSFGGQAYFYQQYNAYLNVDVSLFASNFMDSVVNQLFADIGNYLWANAPPLLGAIAILFLARKLVRPRRIPSIVAQCLAPGFAVASLFIPTQHRFVQASTPDVLYLHAVGGLIRTQLGFTDQSHQLRPKVRESLPVPKLDGKPPLPRNVVLVILESVRADATCIEYDPDCRRTEATNLLFPKRFPLNQMRSLDSSTAISLAVLWSGVGPTESRDVLHTWPLLFDYARAAGWNTAYWTSQNMMFGNARLWVKNLGANRFVSATDLDPTCDLDMGAPENLLADYVNRDMAELREPFFAVIHLSNVHYPYYVNKNGPQPFQPATTSKAPGQNQGFFNYYQNAVYQQDQHVAKMLGHLRETDAGKHTVIIYLSDHAEAFREHGQMGHTFSVFDEEIHVPAWIDAPPGTLTDDEAKALAAKKDAFTFQVDITPTVMDLMGLSQEKGIAKYEKKWLGHSLLRPALTTEPLPMTNCAGVWSCAFENWGYMKQNLKIEARGWDQGWHCYDVAADPLEENELPLERCAELERLSLSAFGRLPGRKKD